ncbi:tetratricopeptide repeat protein [Shewanella waksmanii]|uniref:tetratricopeptide repeat protein n=1 Tax=Shewanella waksmanii TaxID=213783 RepID=UPI00048F138D|nr:hypothetical protein [Shewanella waksmanii]
MIVNKTSFVISLLLIGLCFICYYPAIYAPFYIDDFGSLVGNSKLNAINIPDLWSSYGMRFIGYLSFALSSVYFGEQPQDFRWLNILIHAAVAISVFILIRLLLISVWVKGKDKDKELLIGPIEHKKVVLVAAILACVYAVHPLNTQAVTYVVQRLASLVTLFYLLACVSYLYARITTDKVKRCLSAAFCFATFALAILTKQNAVTLPLMLLLFEVTLFASRRFKRNLLFAGMVCLLLSFMATLLPAFEHSLALIDSASRETTLISRVDYFATQMAIILDYMNKFFWPTGLQLNYPNITKIGFTETVTWLAAMAHITIVAVSIVAYKRFPLITIGVFFYYIAHLVESSIIPITDIGFEHRAYLPNVGLIICWAGVLIELSNKLGNKLIVAVGALVVCCLGYLTYDRNTLWSDKKAFSQNEVIVAPQSIRAHTMLAAVYVNEQKPLDAMREYQVAIDLSVEQGKVSYGLLRDYIRVLYSLGQYESAGTLTTLVMKYTSAHRRKDRSEVLALIAVSHMQASRFGFAKGLLRQSLKLDPANGFAVYQLGSLLWRLGEREEALKLVEGFNPKSDEDQAVAQLHQQMLQIISTEQLDMQQ